MLVIIKSAPDMPEGERGASLAKDLSADLVLLQNGVYFAQKGRLEGFRGAVYILEDDSRLRGLKDEEFENGVKKIDYDGLIDLMSNKGKIIGMF